MSETNTDATNRIARMSQVMRHTAMPVLAAKDETNAASEALKAAGSKATSTRMETIVALAGVSQQGQWDASEIKQAIAQTINGTNGEAAVKTMKTFLGECREAMLPNVRSHVPHLRDLIESAWLQEAAGDKDDDKPIRKAFKRGYHATVAAFRLAAGGTLLTDIEEVVAWAVENDPDLDYKKVAARLEAITASIRAFHADFPVAGLDDAARYLDNIDKKALKAARETVTGKAEAETTSRLASHKLAPTLGAAAKPVQVAGPTPAPASVSAAFNPADDVLGRETEDSEPSLAEGDDTAGTVSDEVLEDLHSLAA